MQYDCFILFVLFVFDNINPFIIISTEFRNKYSEQTSFRLSQNPFTFAHVSLVLLIL